MPVVRCCPVALSVPCGLLFQLVLNHFSRLSRRTTQVSPQPDKRQVTPSIPTFPMLSRGCNEEYITDVVNGSPALPSVSVTWPNHLSLFVIQVKINRSLLTPIQVASDPYLIFSKQIVTNLRVRVENCYLSGKNNRYLWLILMKLGQITEFFCKDTLIKMLTCFSLVKIKKSITDKRWGGTDVGRNCQVVQ